MEAMPSRVVFFVLVALLVKVSQSSKNSRAISKQRDPSVPREFCEFETFQPSCWKGEVIVMKSALYGRMRIGRCVEANLGYLGCSAEVLDAADRKCSGRQSCSIAIPDVDFDATKPCYKELKMYLDASYACQKVAEEDRGCTVFATSTPFPVALPSISRFGCGSKVQPWIVEVVPGQRINVTLVDFFRDPDPVTETGERSQRSQVTRGVVVDREAGKNVTVLAGAVERERWIYQSKGNILEVYISAREPAHARNDGQYEFLFRFEAVGCADLRPPGDAWISRDGNELTIGCRSTRQTWHLQCQGQRWSGVIGNCTSAQMAAKKEALVNTDTSGLPHALAIATVAGVALSLCLLIVCIGVVVLRRFAKQDRLRDLAKAALNYDNIDSEDEIVQAYYTRTKRDMSRGSTAPSDPSAYSHVWELPLPDLAVPEVTATSPAATPAAPPSDKQDLAAYNGSARSDETRYFVLDRSVAGGPNNPVPGGSNRASESAVAADQISARVGR